MPDAEFEAILTRAAEEGAITFKVILTFDREVDPFRLAENGRERQTKADGTGHPDRRGADTRQLGEMVRGTVEEALNAMLDAEADRLWGAGRYERSEGRRDTRRFRQSVRANSTGSPSGSSARPATVTSYAGNWQLGGESMSDCARSNAPWLRSDGNCARRRGRRCASRSVRPVTQEGLSP
ncbi:MAG: hypothetical protein N838_21515 [Thiohalocapsa sp. PB-PSB1]|jgi:hypothetical protein|nr:MAG: hypothetical protein N838_21515 [Thiohalocapsa sp. PB-PSB1]